MLEVIRRRAAILGGLVFLAPAGAAAQVKLPTITNSTSALLSAVLEYRLAVLDATPIKACSVLTLMDRPQDFPHAFPRQVQDAFDRRATPCDPPEQASARDTAEASSMRGFSRLPKVPGCVVVASVQRSDSTASVFATVTRLGDAVHTEEFKAVYSSRRQRWVVTEARLFGLYHPYPGGCP